MNFRKDGPMKTPARLDQQYVWHPFTQMRDWLRTKPIVIASGKGAVLRDTKGKEYLDGNSSIWTNLHGHAHPKINGAIKKQLKKIAHSSALGLANEPASFLAERLVKAANGEKKAGHFAKVFYSDDGSTALEVALKLAYEFTRRSGRSKQPKFISLEGAYHGDTVGAVSLGHIDLFHKAYKGLLFSADKLQAPYCYRCPFNKAKPERADARTYRKCNSECTSQAEKVFSVQKKKGNPYAGFAFEPLMQGAAGMIAQPSGWLKQVTDIAKEHGALLIADEVMTGFGRTDPSKTHFACQQAKVQPDFLCLAKGLTGGYLPMAATLTTQRVFDAFLGEYHEFKTFFHGHSYTGNQLGAVAGLASLDLLETEKSLRERAVLQQTMREALLILWTSPYVGDVRQVGLVAGIELVKDWRTRKPFELKEQAGIRVCQAMAKRGVLTRPIGSVIALMPPYCTTPKQMKRMVAVLLEAIEETFPQAKS
ncbi:MAG: adenosylmethionine-8-amino-7-oxononanoate aminotransferase [Verrucomicrobia bacterium]|nr:adenosylmethionine-8-amino-7-oxononanoate aminotransferase [Verrucomicrobiota bacterium]